MCDDPVCHQGCARTSCRCVSTRHSHATRQASSKKILWKTPLSMARAHQVCRLLSSLGVHSISPLSPCRHQVYFVPGYWYPDTRSEARVRTPLRILNACIKPPTTTMFRGEGMKYRLYYNTLQLFVLTAEVSPHTHTGVSTQNSFHFTIIAPLH